MKPIGGFAFLSWLFIISILYTNPISGQSRRVRRSNAFSRSPFYEASDSLYEREFLENSLLRRDEDGYRTREYSAKPPAADAKYKLDRRYNENRGQYSEEFGGRSPMYDQYSLVPFHRYKTPEDHESAFRFGFIPQRKPLLGLTHSRHREEDDLFDYEPETHRARELFPDEYASAYRRYKLGRFDDIPPYYGREFRRRGRHPHKPFHHHTRYKDHDSSSPHGFRRKPHLRRTKHRMPSAFYADLLSPDSLHEKEYFENFEYCKLYPDACSRGQDLLFANEFPEIYPMATESSNYEAVQPQQVTNALALSYSDQRRIVLPPLVGNLPSSNPPAEYNGSKESPQSNAIPLWSLGYPQNSNENDQLEQSIGETNRLPELESIFKIIDEPIFDEIPAFLDDNAKMDKLSVPSPLSAGQTEDDEPKSTDALTFSNDDSKTDKPLMFDPSAASVSEHTQDTEIKDNQASTEVRDNATIDEKSSSNDQPEDTETKDDPHPDEVSNEPPHLSSENNKEQGAQTESDPSSDLLSTQAENTPQNDELESTIAPIISHDDVETNDKTES